ncbi:MAG: LTA synthase family protein, partial [Prevotellaceae bacterium]|nr:LTA synthase family protein [Candidatus Colivivens equi]
MTIKRSILSSILALAYNLVLVYVIYFLCRAIYLFENWSAFSEGLGALSFNNVLNGCFKFDTSAILYTNAFYAIMMLLPLGVKENISYQKIAKWIFLLVNSIAVIVNLCDAVYFQYTGRRTTVSVFQEFSNDNNILDVFGIELVRHWYLFLAGIL